MIASESMRGATVAVLGLGASGRSVCRSLAAGLGIFYAEWVAGT